MAPATELITVIVPCYNEAAAIAATIEHALEVAESLPMRVEFVLIDDGSTDDTRAHIERICASHPQCCAQINPRNLGLGSSVVKAYQSIPDGSWVSVLPGDGEIEFASIRDLIAVREDADVVMGYIRNPVIRTFRRRAASWGFQQLVRTLYGFNFQYLNGLKLYRVEAVRDIDVVSKGHAYFAELLAKAVLRDPSLRIVEAPYVSRGRKTGVSKAFSSREITRAMRELAAGKRSVDAYRHQLYRE